MAQNFFYALVGKPVDTTCSCTQCNNENCFGKRQNNNKEKYTESCSCENCVNAATCILYKKNKNRSVGCGASPAFNLTPAADIGDGYESKFQTCCDGRRKFVAPGHVFELPKYCGGCGKSVTNKPESSRHVFEHPIPATPECESSGYVLEVSKENQFEGKTENKSTANAYMLTNCIQKPHAKINSQDCCHISVKKNYKSPASVLEQQGCINSNGNELPGIVYDLKKFPQNLESQKCTGRKCIESAKIKSDTFVCMTVSPKNPPECDKCMNRNEYESPIYEHGRTKPQKKYSHESCEDSLKDCNLGKYVLDLRKINFEHNDSECYECTKTNENESLRNSYERKKINQKPQSPKNSHECCHDSAIHKSESSGCGFETQKRSNDYYQCNKCSKRNGSESPDQTKWIPKPLVQTNSCSCHESANNKYKSYSYVLEPVKPLAQKTSSGCCDSAKKKSELSGYVLELPVNVRKKNECDRYKFKKLNEYELMKCTDKSQAQKNSHDCGHDSAKNSAIAKYVLNLRKKYSDSLCHKCAKMNENDSLRNAKEPKKCTPKQDTRKSCDCGHDSAKHKSVSPGKELSTCLQQKIHKRDSTKSTTTCSSECWSKHEKKHYAQPANPPTVRELMMSSSSLSQLCNRKSKESTTCADMYNSMPETLIPCCEDLKGGSKISSPDAMYAIMTDTLKKQESVVETQKDAYLCNAERKCKPSPAVIYASMTEKEHNNVVDLLKSAYLPQNSLAWNPKYMPKKKCSCKHNQRADRTKETEKIISNVPSKRSLELVTRKQCFKGPDTRITKSCSCKKGKVSSTAKTSNQEVRSSVVESLDTDYETIFTDCGPKKKVIAEKCSCKHKKKEKNKILDPNEDIQIYWSTNETSQNAFYGPLRDKQGSLDYLRDIKLPNMLSKKYKKLDLKKQGSKENQIDIQYIPFKRPTSCNSEKVTTGLPSNALCIGLSNTDQDSNTLKCNTMSDISKTSSSSKIKTSQGSEKNIQLFNINRFGTKGFTSDTMHMFYNTNSECKLVKNKFESPKYSVKSQQYTPTKNAQELFKNILQIHGYEIETLINRYQKKSGESNTFTKDIESVSSRNLNDLPESSLISIKRSLSARNNSKSSGCLSKIHTYRTSSHEPPRYVKDFNINRLETKTTSSFHCKDTAKQKSMSPGNECGSCLSTAQKEHENKNGYVVDVQKFMHNSTKQKKGCKCRELAKNKFESSRYIAELSKNGKHEKRKCDCNDSAKHKSEKQGFGHKTNSELPGGYVLDLTKYTRQCNSCSSTQSAKKPTKCGYNTQKCNSCSSTQIAKKPSKCGHNTQKCNSCSSTQIPKKPSKCGHNTQKCKSCSSTQIAKKPSKCGHNTPENAEEVSILKLISKSVQSEIENICKNMVGTQTDIIESLFLHNPESENAIELCKDILKSQIHTIDVLKKIYFPQKNTNSNRTSELSQNTCFSLPNSIETCDNINKNKNTTIQPETAKLNGEELTKFNGCLACKQSNISIKQKKVSKYDIIQKLKEAYKACSCKICECVANKAAAKPDACKCKPCECDECKSLFLSHETNERQTYNCFQCTKLHTEQLRNDSSQTSGCKTKGFHQGRNLVVAPVEIDDTVSHVACTCSPCACIECGLIYPLGSTLINEMSTSTNRHALCRCEVCLNENCDRSGFDSCKCQMRNKVMSKPVEHDAHDFDIRTAMIVHNTPMPQQVCRSDPIAMFAAVRNTYPTIGNGSSNTKICSCKECECMFCVSQKDAIKSSQVLFNTARTKLNFNNRTENCEFKLPSECQFNKEIQNHQCTYDKYSSLNCEIKSIKYSSNEPHTFESYPYRNYTYGPSYIKEIPGSVTLPFKKGDVLTPSTHKLKVRNQILQKQHLKEHCTPNATTNTDSSSNQEDFNILHELTTTEWNTSNKIGSITKANMYMNDFKTKYIDKRKTLKYDAYMYCQEINKKTSLYNNVVLENVPVPESCFSDHSSSCYKDYGIKTQNTQSNNKSRETFYNSSGHKYPEYLLQYSQKGTIGTSLKDVIHLDINETRRLDNCNFIPSNIEKHNIDKKYESVSGDENSFKINNNSDNALIETLCRNYKFELSNNLRVQSSNKNGNKHHENNGIQNKERDQLQGTCLTGSQYSIKVNNEKREYFKAINDFNEFHVPHKVFDYNMSARHSLTIHNEHSDLFTSTEILNANDYRRVKNTLNEAREFSQELTKLLKTYEKANNEFQSISDRLKLSHEGLFSSDIVRRFSSHTQKQHKQ